MKFELKMPDLSTTGSPMKILRWRVAVGEFVERGQAVLEVETDKATMEVEALNPGILLQQMVGLERKPLPAKCSPSSEPHNRLRKAADRASIRRNRRPREI